MKINDTRMEVLDRAIEKELAVATDRCISLYRMDDYKFGHREPVRYGVNWSAIGTVEALEAKTYAILLQKAASLAQGLNNMKLELDLKAETDPEIHGPKSFDIAVSCVRTLIQTENYIGLYMWVEAGNRKA